MSKKIVKFQEGDFRVMQGKKCEECGRGRYGETSFFNYMNGTLECDRCRHVVPKYRSIKEEIFEKAVCKSLFKFKSDYKLTYDDLSGILGSDSKSLRGYKKDGRLPIGNFFAVEVLPEGERDLRESCSYSLAIFLLLAGMFSEQSDRTAWLKTKHKVLKKVPIDMMKDGREGLIAVHSYLDFVISRGA